MPFRMLEDSRECTASILGLFCAANFGLGRLRSPTHAQRRTRGIMQGRTGKHIIAVPATGVLVSVRQARGSMLDAVLQSTCQQS